MCHFAVMKNDDPLTSIGWKITRIRFRNDVVYEMFHQLILDGKIEFLTLDLSSKRERHYSQIGIFYADARSVTIEKYNCFLTYLQFTTVI